MSGGQRKAKRRRDEREDHTGIKIIDFEPDVAASLPATHALLMSSNLTVHRSVSKVVLHGSRGLRGGFRSHSDIDLSLIVDPPSGPAIEQHLEQVLETTLSHWHGPVEPDLAVIFDIQNCGLKCFEQIMWNEQICNVGGTDCFGLYKTQKGFHGLVTNAGIQIKLIYPCLTIWERR